MCSHYQALKDRERYRRRFGVDPPEDLGKYDVWPSYPACFIRSHPHAGVGDEAVPAREACVGLYGLVPHWAKDTTIGRHTFNARSETVAQKPSFRDAWSKRRHCIIPAEAIFEPDWRSGRAVPTRIARADGLQMALAGLWGIWRGPNGENVHSFTMLTINADQHPLMKNFHKPGDEKRMVVILPDDSYEAWLRASPQDSMDFMQQYPADLMTAHSASTSK